MKDKYFRGNPVSFPAIAKEGEWPRFDRRKMPFKRVRKITNTLASEIQGFSKPELKRLIGECGNLTDTNCGWMMYGLKDIVKEIAKCQLRWLKSRKDLVKSRKPEAKP